MSLNGLSKWLSVIAICCLNIGCQQLSDDIMETEEVGRLKVKTRSAIGEELVYPLTLYAFSSDGDCIVSQTVEDEEETLQLSLPEGKYKVVALSGYSDDYLIPTEPQQNDVVQMKGEEGASTPLMIGKADVTVGADKESKLDMTLSYAVTAIDLVLSNVPSDVAKVSVTLSSFYSSMSMEGEYVDSDCSLNLACSLDTENQWSTQTRYVFPGNASKTTLSITMKMKNGEEVTYGYVWKDTPQAGQPYHLQGEYSDGLSLNGSFVIAGWNDAEEVKFEFGAESSEDEEGGEEDDPVVDLSGLPEVGTIWNGTIVADIVEADESGADLLLMSLDEWDATTSDVEYVEDGYMVNGISGWRLPTHDEAAVLRAKFSGDNRLILNELIAEYDSDLWGLSAGEKERYLCLKYGEFYSFQFIGGTKTTSAGEKRSYYVRLVKTYHASI